MENDLVRSLRLQSKACAALGSPFHAALLEHAADDLAGGGGPLEPLLAPWKADDLRALMAAAVPLRLLGALHDLVLSGDAPSLADAYPRRDQAADPARAWSQARRALAEHSPSIRAFIDHEPQTNEVRRSVALLGGFLTIAKETGLPLRCFELAASAGLNLSWDQYRYQLGDAAWGPESPVFLPTDWSGPCPPLDQAPRVIERAACDRRPTDISDPLQRRRLLAYIWPDQFERLDRIRAAIDMALARGVQVETADAPSGRKEPGRRPAPPRSSITRSSGNTCLRPVRRPCAKSLIAMRKAPPWMRPSPGCAWSPRRKTWRKWKSDLMSGQAETIGSWRRRIRTAPG